LKRKIAFFIALLLAWRETLAITASFVVGGAASGVASGVALALGFDPMPWAIGAMGSTVVYAYKRPATRAESIANGVICVFLGGIAAPWAGSLLELYVNRVWGNEYLLAGVLSATWPWLAPRVGNLLLNVLRLRSGLPAKEKEACNE
jgi:hypothetical protein